MSARWSIAALLVTAVAAQEYAPPNANTTAQNARNNYPFQRTGARVQNFVDVGDLTNATFTTNALSFRWDEATAGTGATATFANLVVRVGDTTRAYNSLDGSFANNLIGSIERGSFTATNYSFTYPPVTPVPLPPWGNDGTIRFPLANPALIAVPAGGCFYVDIAATTRTGPASNALLDFCQDATAIVAGTAVAAGVGCPGSAGGLNASITVGGQFAPGTAMSVGGANYAPSSPYATFLSVPGAPFTFPWAPACALNMTLGGPLPIPVIQGATSATGAIPVFAATTFVQLPRSLTPGSQLAFQNIGFTTPFVGNAAGIYSSPGAVITLGTTAATSTPCKGWFAGHHLDSASPAASFNIYGVFAMRME